ncbi:MAG: efflux RND transporter periplasmic adaptor subunit, partial [Pseudomonadota bacterium]
MRPATFLRTVIGIVVIVVLAVVLYLATLPPPLVVQGQVSADEVDISPRVSGRVAALHADVGDTVKQGDMLVELTDPELVAALAASKAALVVSEANLRTIETVRPEAVTAQTAQVAADQADVDLYQGTYNRERKLLVNGDAPQAGLDQATRNLQAALRKKEADEAQLALVTEGASAEQRALAAAQVKQADAAVAQQAVDVDELHIVAPISGEVTTRIAEMGENFSPGAPLYALIDVKNSWVTFNLREDLLAGLKVGDTFNVDIPALGAKDVAVKVTVINVEGQYATWRATRATGDFDLRTFEIRAKPVAPLAGLRPGMSV